MATIENRVHNVNVVGGVFGLLSSPRMRLEREIRKLNQDGWAVCQVLPGNPNPLFWILCWCVLVLTLFAYMPLPAYMVIAERVRQ